MIPCRPYFLWGWPGETSELTLMYPQRPWKYVDGGVGGTAVAAAGIVESFVVREDDILLLEIRVDESELPAFRQFLRWARGSGASFTIRLDASDPTTEFQVLLESPTWGETPRVQHERSPDFPGVLFIPIGIRPELGGTFDVSWFALATQGE